ncbi:MAG: MoaD/ThiS family protein [Phycisphaerales bacterium]
MRVQVLLFGSERAAVGRASVEIEFDGKASAREVLRALGERWPALKGKRLAVNHAFATGEEMIGPKDEVALIGMVSGG